MDFKNNISEIKTQIKKKEGKEWLGLQNTTEQKLESLIWYLDHPKITEFPRLLEEVINLYYKARESGFIKMEGIIRKLDQLKIKLGKHDYKKKEKESKKSLKFINYPKEIKNLKDKIEIMIQSPYGTSLPDSTHELIITLLNYLNHPNLPMNKRLFDEVYDVYQKTREDDYLKMQSFKDMLDKIEIKLGDLPNDLKQFKTLEEKREELEKDRKRLRELERGIEKDKENFEKERHQMELELKNLEVERIKIKEIQKNLREEQEKFDKEKNSLQKQKEDLSQEKEDLERQRKKLMEKWEMIKSFEEKIRKMEGLVAE